MRPPAPALATSLQPSAYVGEAAWDRDRRGVFEQAWVVLGAAAEWAAPGEAAEVEQGGASIVVVRAQDGTLRAFFNVCPHRAAPLMWPGDRAAGRDALRCRYHGWRFNLDGALIGAPDFDGQRAGVPAGLSGCGLQRVPVVEALGLVWAWLGTGSPAPSPDQDGPLHAALAPLGLGAWRARRRASHSLACNWKTYVENYLEGYHIPYLHPGLSRELHLEGYAVEPVGAFGVRHLAPTAPGALNEGLWLWVWPNVAINVYGRAASLERMVPVGPTTTRIDYVYLADDRLSDEALDALVAMSARTTDEDKRICEAVAHNLGGGRARPGPLSPRHEAGLAQFHALLRAAWAPSTADTADTADLGG